MTLHDILNMNDRDDQAVYFENIHQGREMDLIDEVIVRAINEGKTMELIEAGDTELIARLQAYGWAPAEARAFIRDFSHRLHVACFGPGYNSSATAMDTNSAPAPAPAPADGTTWADDCIGLEQLIDARGLATVLEMIQTVCSEKAKTIAWRGEPGARPWRKAGAILHLARRHENVQAVTPR